MANQKEIIIDLGRKIQRSRLELSQFDMAHQEDAIQPNLLVIRERIAEAVWEAELTLSSHLLQLQEPEQHEVSKILSVSSLEADEEQLLILALVKSIRDTIFK